MSKLTEEQRSAIKASEKSQIQLAKEYGVSPVTISKLKNKQLQGQGKSSGAAID